MTDIFHLPIYFPNGLGWSRPSQEPGALSSSSFTRLARIQTSRPSSTSQAISRVRDQKHGAGGKQSYVDMEASGTGSSSTHHTTTPVFISFLKRLSTYKSNRQRKQRLVSSKIAQCMGLCWGKVNNLKFHLSVGSQEPSTWVTLPCTPWNISNKLGQKWST